MHGVALYRGAGRGYGSPVSHDDAGGIGSDRLPAAGQADPDPPLRGVSRRGQAAGRATARHGRGRAQGGQERAGGHCRAGRREPADRRRAGRRGGRTHAAQPAAALPRARSSLLQDWIDQGAKAERGEQPGVAAEPVALGVHPAPRRPDRPGRREPALGSKPDRPLHSRPGSSAPACRLPPKPIGRPCCAG